MWHNLCITHSLYVSVRYACQMMAFWIFIQKCNNAGTFRRSWQKTSSFMRELTCNRNSIPHSIRKWIARGAAAHPVIPVSGAGWNGNERPCNRKAGANHKIHTVMDEDNKASFFFFFLCSYRLHNKLFLHLWKARMKC